ncbi:MAG: type II toxin-antitoxin system VapB family antitoxin [Rhizobium pusense]|nr:type II toxin-antitoxin system VapB family antitoxin [Agrobacterium pusense]
MPLYIKDEEVNQLADELTGLTKTSKTEAVRSALQSAIAIRKANLPIREKLAKTLALSKEYGPYGPGDQKAETDELWGNL